MRTVYAEALGLVGNMYVTVTLSVEHKLNVTCYPYPGTRLTRGSACAGTRSAAFPADLMYS